MSESVPTAYDIVAYPGYAYVQTHPDHLAAYARLCGIDPAPVETCRVLEVGCGDAANLLPMAATLPHSTFVGFDLAAGSIERGRAVARQLGLTNLTLEHLDITAAPAHMGEFDYVIAHGFYSWVPQSARDQLMVICRESLAPQGVAFISYNALPGSHIRRMLREIMLFHVDRAFDPETRTTQAKAILGFLSRLAPADDEYQAVFKKELERVRKYQDAHLYHDDLAPIFDSFYLHEFLTHAAGYGLQYLADMNSTFVHVETPDAETSRALSELDSDPILREQYLDFACCRRFRQTLLCRSGVTVQYRPDPARVDGLLVSSPAKLVSGDVDLGSNSELEFRGDRNASLKTAHPLMKAAMLSLCSAWPERLSIEDLQARIARHLEVGVKEIAADLLRQALLSGFGLRILDFHAYRPKLTRSPGERPRTNPLIRLQAQTGAVLTNLLHQPIKLEGASPVPLPLLDGTRTRANLAAELQLPPAEIDTALSKLAQMALIEM